MLQSPAGADAPPPLAKAKPQSTPCSIKRRKQMSKMKCNLQHSRANSIPAKGKPAWKHESVHVSTVMSSVAPMAAVKVRAPSASSTQPSVDQFPTLGIIVGGGGGCLPLQNKLRRLPAPQLSLAFPVHATLHSARLVFVPPFPIKLPQSTRREVS